MTAETCVGSVNRAPSVGAGGTDEGAVGTDEGAVGLLGAELGAEGAGEIEAARTAVPDPCTVAVQPPTRTSVSSPPSAKARFEVHDMG